MSQDRDRRQPRAARPGRSRRAPEPSAVQRGVDAVRSVLGKPGAGVRRAGDAATPHFRRASKENVRAQAEQGRAAGRSARPARGQGVAGRGEPPFGSRGAAVPHERSAGRAESAPRRSGAGRNVMLAGGAAARDRGSVSRGGSFDDRPYGRDREDAYGADVRGYARGEDTAYGYGGYEGRQDTHGGYGDAYGGGYDAGFDAGYGSSAPYGGEDDQYFWDARRDRGGRAGADRIVPDVPRKPHRYMQPDLGPAPGARPRRGGGSALRHHGNRLFLARPGRRHSVVPLIAVGVAALLVFGAGAAMINGYVSAQRAAEEAAAAAEEQAQRERAQAELAASFSLAKADLNDIPAAADEATTFSLTKADAPTLTENEQKALATALAPVEELGSVGFTLIDLQTGFGLAYNVSEPVYGASSFKLPYAVYLCQDLVEGGAIALDDTCPTSSSGLSVAELIRASVVDSDNDSFVVLREAYDEEDFDAWIEGLGVTDLRYNQESFPTLSTLSLTKLWADAYQYFQTGGETASWLEGLCGQTTTSFIRDGITQPGVTVYNKAGWYPSDDVDYRSVTDAGIVEDADGDVYLLAIMTGMSYNDESVSAFEELANIIFETRGALATDAGGASTADTAAGDADADSASA